MENAIQGAKGIASFEENIKHGYLPQESSIEHEGLYYDYYFTTASSTDKHLEINYSCSISKDPIAVDEKEYYISVGMTSYLDGAGLYKHGGRPKLNLMICLDISGSMSCSFDGEEGLSKLEVAKQSLVHLLSKLTPEDYFGILLFDDKVEMLQKLTKTSSLDIGKLKSTILALETRGGTNLSIGFKAATSEIEPQKTNGNQNRIIFLTDMMLNAGETSENGLFDLAKKNADKQIYSTFVGVGIDFNNELTKHLGKIRATNYLSIKSSRDFKKHIEEEFDYIVTPSLFNISISLDQSQESLLEPIRVYGSPGYEIPSKGLLMFVDSTFPSPKSMEDQTQTKGGIVLIKLKRKGDFKGPIPLKLKVSYEAPDGNKYEEIHNISFPDATGYEDYFQDKSIRKVVLLTRYVNFMKSFIKDIRNGADKPSMNKLTGIPDPDPSSKSSDVRVRKAITLNDSYKDNFKIFIDHFHQQMEIIDDPALDREFKTINDIYTI